MKKILIVFGIVLLLVGAYSLFMWWAPGLAGGGGSEQIVPDTAKAGEPVTIGLIFDTWSGTKTSPIIGRYTDISLHYRLVGESTYKSLQPKLVALPSNYQAVLSDTRQYEKYDFTIPAYPKGTTGEIEYSVDFLFDGYANHSEGIKKIKIVN